MRNAFKMFLIPILLLSAIGAVAQTVAANGPAGSTQENGITTAAVLAAPQLNERAELFIRHLENDGLLDHAFMKGIASLAPSRAVSAEAVSLCKPACGPGLVCCSCLATVCETRTQCNIDCQR